MRSSAYLLLAFIVFSQKATQIYMAKGLKEL